MKEEETDGTVTTTVRLSRSDSGTDSCDDDVSTINEDYGSQSLDIPGFGGPNSPATVAHITNSRNVEIKPTTHAQYYAPVTINQYLNTGLSHDNVNSTENQNPVHPPAVTLDLGDGNNPAKTDKESKPQVVLDTRRKKLYHAIKTSLRLKLGIVSALLIVVTVVIVVVIFCIGNETTKDVDIIPEEPNYDLGDEIYIFPKSWWGGLPTQPSKENRTLLHPTKLVIIAHTAAPRICMTREECANYLQTIQTMHISESKRVDIGYNFMIGGDGNIYEGLGWDNKNYVKNNSIEIAFIGNYAIVKINDRQRNAARKLIDVGVKLGKLDVDYELIGHNQAAATVSPGIFLIEEIKHWPHYSKRLHI